MTLVHKQNFVFIQPQSHLDAQGGIHLKQQLATIAPVHGEVWILDMARVEFIDSAGLVAIISALNAATRSNCRLVLCNVRPSIRLIFEITQLDQAFEIVSSLAEITEPALPTAESVAVDANLFAA